MSVLSDNGVAAQPAMDSTSARLDILRQLERKVLWLSTWMIHHANFLRPKHEGIGVGGHPASSASLVTLMTALYFDVLQPQDRVAVKPHASPVFHAIQYLLGRQTRVNLERFRALGGTQAYPSRTKDSDDVDFSTGSVGLGVAMTIFSSLVQNYLRQKRMLGGEAPAGRMVALVGDAELDEGSVFEAMFEGWKHDIRNVWWVIDYNRQSLDSIAEDRLFQRIDSLFQGMGWNVQALKYGHRLQHAFEQSGGQALRQWIDACPNWRYSALVFKGGAAWRRELERDLGGTSGVRALLDEHDDDSLQALMTNLAGHDMASVLKAFHSVDDDRPTCFIAYTIKGYGLPLAGHKDNHSGLLSPEQMDQLQASMGIDNGDEWEPLSGLDMTEQAVDQFLASVPFAAPVQRCHKPQPIPLPDRLPLPAGRQMSTQTAFGRLLNSLARGSDELAGRIVTTSPDVTLSTELGGWVNKRGIFDYRLRQDPFDDEEDMDSSKKWWTSPDGQHIELGIAENNMFLLLAALGLSGPLFGQRLFPVSTLYDPFIRRGLDALDYACYQDARFLLVGTPSGITLAPEGGSHQSLMTPLIGIAQPGLTSFEPAFVDELTEIMLWSFQHMQADDGESVYLRLSTRKIEQPQRQMTPELREAILQGGYWLVPPSAPAPIAIVCSGAVTPQAIAAHRQIQDDIPGAGLLVVTSSDRLHRAWFAAEQARADGRPHAKPPVKRLLDSVCPDGELVTVIDGHPLSLSWLGAVAGHRVIPMGVDRFGQSGDLAELCREYRLDQEAILAAISRRTRPAEE